MSKVFFITGTDTSVGKTIATLTLGLLFKERGLKVGVMKPVQCAGNDAQFLKNALKLKDSLLEINPCFTKEPLSPHLAFSHQGKAVDLNKIQKAFEKLKSRYDVLLIEGAGGLMVPLNENYYVSNLARDLDAELIIVARLGLGTINHTLLTINQAKASGLKVKGIIFSAQDEKSGIPEKTNPEIISQLSGVPVLGVIPFLKKKEPKEILTKCSLNIDGLLNPFDENRATQLQHNDKKYIWHPFTQMKDWLSSEPLVIDQAQGCYLIDSNGNRYIDGVSSLWVNVHGHRRQEIDQAIKNQIDKVSHSTFLGLTNIPAIELAKKLIEIAPRGLKKVFYSDNGSTAVEVAIKMAYQYWQNAGQPQKTRLAHLANSYHGDTLGSVSVGGIGLFHQVYRKLIFETISVEFPDFYRSSAGKNYPKYTEECLTNLENIFKKEHDTIAALIVEPLVQGAAGMIVWPDGILKRIAQLCKKYNVLLIADEVATGFGRTGKMFACEHENVTPDFLCLAKGLTGGYLPLAATLTTQHIFDGFLFDYKAQKTFFHGHTYTGNPLACAAALANLKIFEKDQTLRELQPKIKYLAKGLKKFYNLASVGDVRQKGFMVGIELVKDRRTKAPFPWEKRVGMKVCEEVRKHGVILRPLGNVIVLMPPLVISMKQIDQLLSAIYEALNTVQELAKK